MSQAFLFVTHRLDEDIEQAFRAVAQAATGLGDAFRPMPPVDRSDRLAVTVHATIGDIDFTAGLLYLPSIPPYLRGCRVLLRVRQVNHDQYNQRKNRQRTGHDGRKRHFHFTVAPGLKKMLRMML